MTTLNIPAPAKWEGPRQAQWKEARSVFPIYLALAKQLEFEIPFPQAKRNLPEIADLEIFSQVHEWLDSMDQRVMVHQLRHLLQMTTLNASEAGLRALIQRHLRKTTKSNVDRDKIDFLLVQYFALCAPAKIYHKQIEPADVAQVIQPVLGDCGSGTARMVCATGANDRCATGLPRPERDPEDEFHRAGPQGEGNGRRDVLRSRGAGGFSSGLIS